MNEAAPSPIVTRVRDVITDSLAYWEPRRLLFNGALAAVVLVYFGFSWPASKQTLTFNGLLLLFVLAVLANVCYCTAYLADLFVQFSGFTAAWRKYRWLLFAIGTVFAAIITHFFATGFFQ